MGNTGTKIVTTLKQVWAADHSHATGIFKNNVVGDPDYIAPYIDTVGCPIDYNTTFCPDIVATPLPSAIRYEFELPNSVVNNPAIKKVVVDTMVGGTAIDNHPYLLPHSPPNYFSNTVVLLTSGTTYHLRIRYLDASDAVLNECDSTDIIPL